MIFVDVRESGRGLHHERHFQFPGCEVLGSVLCALRELYPDAEHLDTLDIDGAGVFRRVIRRQTLLARRVVIKVRIQGELFG